MILLHDLIISSNAMIKLEALLTEYSESLVTLITALPNIAMQNQLNQLSQLLLNRHN